MQVLSYSIRKLLTLCTSCGNVASILQLDEHLAQEYKVFQHAAVVFIPFLSLLPCNCCQDVRSVPSKRPPADYFL